MFVSVLVCNMLPIQYYISDTKLDWLSGLRSDQLAELILSVQSCCACKITMINELPEASCKPTINALMESINALMESINALMESNNATITDRD